METTTAAPTTTPAKLTREQALDKYGDVPCYLWGIRHGDILFASESDGVEVTITLKDGALEGLYLDRTDVYTMRDDERAHAVSIVVGGHVVYEAEPRGVEFSVDDEDPDGES